MLNERCHRKLCDSMLAESTHLFFNQYAEKISLKVVYGWVAKNEITPKKRENIIYLWSAVYQQTNE